ncbi:glycosyltransferase [Bacillus sp. NTK074B]|nr:glycosyltransferase [Bacillus sp. NTK074B]
MKAVEKRLDFLNENKRLVSEQLISEKELLKVLKSGRDIDDYLKISKLSGPVSDEEYLKYRQEVADVDLYEKVKPLLDQIPDSNGSKYFRHYDVRIGMIADEFLFQAYKGVGNVQYITRQNYSDYADQMDILIVASAWKGLSEEWRGLANPKNTKLRQELFHLMQEFRQKGAKIVFYSKEDPVNYDRFIDIAKECDYIFTTAAEKVEDYKVDCQNENVHVLEFGVNPLYHNPIGTRKHTKRNEVLFAGSWYKKYQHRQEETRMLFDGVLDSGKDLKILDRNYELRNANYFFPKAYLPFIAPAFPHEDLQKLHKLFDWSLNLNSIKYSETMFANRVYELQAIGNLLISNYSVGINNKFPNVFLINDQKEVTEILNRYDEEEVYRQQSHGIRRVMSGETTFDRIEYMMQCIQMPYKKTNRSIAVVVKEMTDEIREVFDMQTYPHKTLYLEGDFTEEIKESTDMVTFFHPLRRYDEFYLEDMVNGFKYTDSDYVTKDSYWNGESFVEGIEHDYVDRMKDPFRTVFWSDSFSYNQLSSLKENMLIPNGYSIDHFEYNQGNIKALNKEVKVPELTVIIPIYNNGEHLLNKCFNSLLRSSVFEYMEILLIDDGSSDRRTISYVKRLGRLYKNVQVYFFNDSGSGSASRARNKGFDLSSSPYITYLDPDNEAVNDGYAVLLDMIKNSEYDMVVGNISRLDTERTLQFNYFNTVLRYAGGSVINDPKKFLIDSNMKAQSIQAAIVRREIIGDHDIKMVMNAGGQDTLFFHELLLNSRKVKAVDLDIHLYYAAVTGSVTNSISKKFFKKYKTLEEYRIPFLIENGLMDAYMETRFNYYFTHWYMKRLPRLSPGEEQEAIDVLFEIYLMYKDYIVQRSDRISNFAKLASKKDYNKIMELATEII